MPSSRLDRGESFPDEVMIVMRRTALANAHVACLHTALARPGPSLNVTAIDPGTMLPVMRWDAPLEFHLAPMFLAGTFDARDAATYGGRPPHDDYRLQRPVIAVATLDESFRMLSELLGSDSSDPLLALADLLTRSAAAFGRYDFSVSLILAWAMIETMITDLWERFIDQTGARAGDEDVPFMNANRRRRLTDSPDLTASLVVEMLSLHEVINFPLYRRLSDVRRARNKYMHELRPVEYRLAASAMEVAEELLLAVHGLRFQMPRSMVLYH